MSIKLLEFPHSHYCEKARWALNFKGLTFQPVAILPGFHLITVRKYAPQTFLPVLLKGSEVVQGSVEIIDYLDQVYPSFSLTPDDPDLRNECLQIEREMGQRLGENLRRVLYYRLLAYPDFIRYCFTDSMSGWKQFIFKLSYPMLRYSIYKAYVVSPEVVTQARQDFDLTVTEIEQRLIQQQYLVGNQFSRADLSVAAMLSWLVMPEEHPFLWRDIPDLETRNFYKDYQGHPVMEWVKKIYYLHRWQQRPV